MIKLAGGAGVTKDVPPYAIVAGTPISRKIFDTIEITPFKYDAQGAFCISADFELSWAWMYANPLPHYNMGKLGRENFLYLLNTLDIYPIPITWATVGHLFLESCEKKKCLAHPDMHRPDNYYENKYWVWKHGDWYQHDPCSNVETDPTWYAPDLIQKILESNIDHEIATHTFSHIDFSNEHCSLQLAKCEIEECIKVMKKFGVTPRSIVFPGNFEGHLNILSKLGIIAYRGGDVVKISYPTRKEGLWNIHQSMSLYPSGMCTYPSERIDFYHRAKCFIDESIRTNSVFHLWFHPSNMHKRVVDKALVPILQYVDNQRKKGNLWVATMGEIANYCETREKTNIEVHYKNKTITIFLRTDLDYDIFKQPFITLKLDIPINLSLKSLDIDGENIKLNTKNVFFKNETSRSLIITTTTSEVKKIIIALS